MRASSARGSTKQAECQGSHDFFCDLPAFSLCAPGCRYCPASFPVFVWYVSVLWVCPQCVQRVFYLHVFGLCALCARRCRTPLLCMYSADCVPTLTLSPLSLPHACAYAHAHARVPAPPLLLERCTCTYLISFDGTPQPQPQSKPLPPCRRPKSRTHRQELQKVYRAIPAYALGEGIIRLSIKSVLEFAYGRPIRVLDTEILGRPLLYLSVMTPVFFALTLIIDSNLPRRLRRMARDCLGSSSGPGCFCGGCGCQCTFQCGGPVAAEQDPETPMRPDAEEEDSDVVRERGGVEAGDGRPGDKVTVQHLRKVYPRRGNSAKKVAVHDLSFGVGTDEIFALLGSNGAGKTTTLSMLSGEFPPTAGRMLLSGYVCVFGAGGMGAALGFGACT